VDTKLSECFEAAYNKLTDAQREYFIYRELDATAYSKLDTKLEDLRTLRGKPDELRAIGNKALY
jgi:hypothetical protein